MWPRNVRKHKRFDNQKDFHINKIFWGEGLGRKIQSGRNQFKSKWVRNGFPNCEKLPSCALLSCLPPAKSHLCTSLDRYLSSSLSLITMPSSSSLSLPLSSLVLLSSLSSPLVNYPTRWSLSLLFWFLWWPYPDDREKNTAMCYVTIIIIITTSFVPMWPTSFLNFKYLILLLTPSEKIIFECFVHVLLVHKDDRNCRGVNI